MIATSVLTESEISKIVGRMKRSGKVSDDEIEDTLAMLEFYGECSMVFSAVISGDFEVTGVSDGGIEYRLSDKAKLQLH